MLSSPIKTPSSSFENKASQMFNRISISKNANEWPDATTKVLSGKDYGAKKAPSASRCAEVIVIIHH